MSVPPTSLSPAPHQDDHAVGPLRNEAPGTLSAPEAESILHRLYDIEGRAEPLASERDHNFRIVTPETVSYVLKVAHPAEDMEIVDFQTSALQHLERVDPGLPVPKVVPVRDGAATAIYEGLDGRPRIVRLLTFLQGTMLCDAAPSPAQDARLGHFLARLGLGLSTFSHRSRGDEALVWDLRQASRSAPLAERIEDPVRKAVARRAFEIFARDVAPRLSRLRTQVVHNDMNPDNVVMDNADPAMPSGILDFGDMAHGPLAADVAIGASYRFAESGHPLAAVARFVGGYHALRPLEDDEIALIPDLVRTRLAISVTMADWQARRFPDNADYALRFNGEMWSLLEALDGLGQAEAQDYLRENIGRT